MCQGELSCWKNQFWPWRNSAHAEGSMWVVGDCTQSVSKLFSHKVNFFISTYALGFCNRSSTEHRTVLQPSSSGTSVDFKLYIYHNKQEILEFITVQYFLLNWLSFMAKCTVLISTPSTIYNTFLACTTTATSWQHLAYTLTLKDRLDDVVAWFPEQWVIINKCIQSKHCVAKTICTPYVVFILDFRYIYILVHCYCFQSSLFRSLSLPADKKSSSREDGFMYPSVITGT